MDTSFDSTRVEALLFDLGGVVIHLDFGRCLQRWARAADRDVEDLAGRFSFDEAYEQHEIGAIDGAGYFASLRRSLAVDLSDEVFADGWNDIYLGADAEVVELLTAAAPTWPVYAFSNSNATHQSVWAPLFAEQLAAFRAVYVSSELGVRKPDRDAYELVAARMGTSPEHVLFFDDGLENVEGARAAGMQAVHVTSSASVRSALALLGVAQ
jgi:putative hydrolase of the HAD superfamily